MKFFSTALAAFAVGSAVAVPVNDARSGPIAAPPCPCDKPDVPSISLPAPTPCTTTPGVQATALPVVYDPQHTPGQVNNHTPGKVDNADVVAVVHVVLETAISVEAKVKADLELIGMSAELPNVDLF
jgi:hypothetical protein